MKGIIFLVALVLLASPLGAAEEFEPMQGAKEPEAALPVIIIGANESVGNIVEPGWPIIVAATVISETEEEAPAFPGSVELKLFNEKDEAAAVVFDPVPAVDPGQRFWIASAAAAGNLTPGRYRVSLEQAPGFTVESGDLTVVLADQERKGSLALLNIQAALLQGKEDEAKAQAEALTVSDPENIDAWTAKGDLLMEQGLFDEAIAAYDKAVELSVAAGDESLFLKQRRHVAQLQAWKKRGVLLGTSGP